MTGPRADGGGGLALVLSGGGAPAAYKGAGVIRAMTELGLRPSVVSGVSAGALNAAAVGIGMDGDRLAELWRGVRWHDVYRPRTDVWNLVRPGNLLHVEQNVVDYALDAIGWTWLLDADPARRTLSREFGGEHPPIRPDVTVVVSAVDQTSGDLARFCTALPPEHRRRDEFRRVRLSVDHLLASAAAPLLFPPVPDGDASYVDAGLVANTPLKPALAYEPDAVVVVSGSGASWPAPVPRTLGDQIGLLVDNVAHFALMADFNHAQTVNALARHAPAATDRRAVPMLLIAPPDAGFSPGRFLQFTEEHAEEAMTLGYQAALRQLADWPYGS